ncbi:MAG: hypothetical protein HYS22_02345 [Deltaproteobacteria bacterium]|nr:hypothetical protein [Deltaproteobacteria bacterium]
MPDGPRTLLDRIRSILFLGSLTLGIILLVNAYYLKQSFASKIISYESEIKRQKAYLKDLLDKTEATILETQTALQEIEIVPPSLLGEGVVPPRAIRSGVVQRQAPKVAVTDSQKVQGMTKSLLRGNREAQRLMQKARHLQRRFASERVTYPYENTP